jgi:hypothetical protein
MDQIWTQMSETIGGYLPKIVAAIAILIIGWIIALIAAAIVRGAIRRTGLGSKLANWLGKGDSTDALGRLAKVSFGS